MAVAVVPPFDALATPVSCEKTFRCAHDNATQLSKAIVVINLLGISARSTSIFTDCFDQTVGKSISCIRLYRNREKETAKQHPVDDKRQHADSFNKSEEKMNAQ